MSAAPKADPVLEALTAIRQELAAIRAAGAPKVTVEQAALLLNCSTSRVFELLSEGQLSRTTGVGKESMVTTASVQRIQREGLPKAKPARRAKSKGSANEVTDDDLDRLVK